MTTKKFDEELSRLLSQDPKFKADSLEICFLQKDKDPLHVVRRQQQRGISNPMIYICLLYGRRKWVHKALTYTLNDRVLRGTTYYSHISKLRGLKVVCVQNTLTLITVYWDKDIKKKRKICHQ